MIVRIVRMQFRPEAIDTFLNMFEERKQRIRHFEGCQHLELWQDKSQPNAFFTYSHWESEKALDHYRFSEFFKETWTLTKSFFSDKAEAWSVERHTIVS